MASRRSGLPSRPGDAAPSVLWRDGVQIAGTSVWCDAKRARDLCFVSHAGVLASRRGAVSHGKVLATAPTLALAAATGLAPTGEALTTPFSRPFSLGALRLELFPSGHVPGAASLLVQTAGRSIVYAGAVNCSAGLSERHEVRGADVLVVDAPYATLAGELPPRAQAVAQLRDEVARALDAERAPILFVERMGLAQEVLALFADSPTGLAAHPSIVAVAAAYRGLGIALPEVAGFSPKRSGPARILIWPIELRNASALARINAHRVAVTGLALDRAAASKLQVDAAVPLSNRLDLPSLLDYVQHTGARDVHLTAGYDARVATALRGRGARTVSPLGAPRQMDLFSTS